MRVIFKKVSENPQVLKGSENPGGVTKPINTINPLTLLPFYWCCRVCADWGTNSKRVKGQKDPPPKTDPFRFGFTAFGGANFQRI